MSMFNGVYQVNVRVRDIQKATKWYVEVLGFSIHKDFGDTVVLRTDHGGGTPLCLIAMPEGELSDRNAENGSHPVIQISSEGAELCQEYLKEKGASILDGSKAHFRFKDPEGNLLEAYLPGLYEDENYAHLR